ncbi:MAG: hypothetical protein IPG05_07385 [Gemmatimonadetes bacterium]|nr:hypothetical protein [Gemmatimonadota bacterium]
MTSWGRVQCLGVVLAVLSGCGAVRSAHAQSLPVVDRHGNFRRIDDEPIGRQRIVQLCGVPGVATKAQLVTLERRRADSASALKTAEAWYALACVRGLLFAAGARAQGGLLMPTGTSWAGGASAALEQAAATPGDHNATARLLGILALETLPADGQVQQSSPDAIIRPDKFAAPIAVGVRDSVTNPYFLRGCVAVSLHRADRSTAEACAYRALAAGHDSTWHFLRLAWIAFRAKQVPLGENLFELAVTTAHDSATRAELGWHLFGRNVGQFELVQHMQSWQRMSPAEVHDLFTVPDSALLGWVRRRNQALDSLTGNYGHRVARHFLTLVPSRGAFNVCPLIVGAIRCYFLGQSRLELDALSASSTLFRVVDPHSKAPLLLVPLTAEPGKAAAGDTLPAMTAEVSIWNAATNQWSSGTMRVKSDSGVKHVLALADPGGPLVWRVHAMSWDDHFVTLRGESAPLAAPFGISDPVLGVEGSGPSWTLGSRTVWLSSSLRFDRKVPIELYLQMWRDSTVREVRIELEMRDAEAEKAPPMLQVKFGQSLDTPFAELTRTLDFSRLGKGKYRMALRVTRPDGVELVERHVLIDLF